MCEGENESLYRGARIWDVVFVPCKYINAAELSGNVRGGHKDRSDSVAPTGGHIFHMPDLSGFCPLTAFLEPTGKAEVFAFVPVVREEA